MNSFLFRSLIAGALVSISATWSIAQGFGEGSFETNENSGIAGQMPSVSGSFDEGSFEPGGIGTGLELAPHDETGPTSSGNVIPEFPQGGTIAGVDGGTPAKVDPPPEQETVVTPPGPVIDPQITAFELRDFGVPAQSGLRQGQFHGPTPTELPGGFIVTTDLLLQAMNEGVEMVIIDVLGSDYSLPSAYSAPALAASGGFNDRTQQQAEVWLQQITGGVWEVPIVIYCSDPMCWLSYNASLRTMAAGYDQVFWYRGGLQAWEMAGLPLHASGF
ncbi:MAG: rhodanese-like domain-containing protein [Sulfitobacter sp.]